MADWKPFTPTAQAVRIMALQDPTQHKRLAVFLDQHRNAAAGFPDGRPWWGYVERAANGADMPGLVGELQPVTVDSMIRGRMYKGWIAPWYPDAKYINETIGLADGNHFEINYAKMESEWRASEEEFYQRAITAALAHDLPVPTLGGKLDYRVRAIVGRPPKSARLAQAAKTGHQWILGFSQEPDELLQRLVNASVGTFEMPTAEEMKAKENETDTLRRQMAEMQAQFQALLAEAGDDVVVPSAEKPKKKRTLSPEHLAKLKAGREKNKQPVATG